MEFIQDACQWFHSEVECMSVGCFFSPSASPPFPLVFPLFSLKVCAPQDHFFAGALGSLPLVVPLSLR